jgi:hypothetical protein
MTHGCHLKLYLAVEIFPTSLFPSLHIVRVILPLPIDRAYSYVVPEHFSHLVRPGRRVVVPFGKRKLAGIVVEEGSLEDLKGYEGKEILDVDMELPLLPAEVLRLTKWIATYYMCSWGEAPHPRPVPAPEWLPWFHYQKKSTENHPVTSPREHANRLF